MSDAGFHLKAKITGSTQRLDALPARAFSEVKRAFDRVGMRFLQRLKTERLAGRPGLNKRTGETARSFQMELGGDDFSSLFVRVFSRAAHVRIQEEGGVIRPTSSQYLAIPLRGATTAAGVALGGPRDFKNTFVFRSKAGNLIIAQRLGVTKSGKKRTRRFLRPGSSEAERSEILPLFVLKKEVTIPPRLGMRALWKEMAPDREAVLRSAFRSAFRRKK